MAHFSSTDECGTVEAQAIACSEGETMSKEQVKRQFGEHAEAYATSSVHAKGASLARLVQLVQPKPDWRALDVATAAGHTAFVFAPHVASVVATDITPEMLPVAAGVAAEKGVENVSFRSADAEDLPFGDAQFDLVTCRIAPHHFPHIDRFLAEAHRVLVPGGILAVVDNVVPGDSADESMGNEHRTAGRYVNEFEKLRDPSHGRCLSVDEWIEAYSDAGLTLRHVETEPKRMAFDPWVKRMGASAAEQQRLLEMLLNAPPAVESFFRPERDSHDVAFYLTEVILVGQKDPRP